MDNVYQQQAQYFANVSLMQQGVIASVHLEDYDDKTFWNAMLQSYRPGHYYIITHSRSTKGYDTTGCEQCLMYRPYLSKRFFVCIDSDMRYLLQESGIDAAHFVCQTYTYSWENHYCEANALQQRFNNVYPEKAATFDFVSFLSEYSKVVYKPLLLLLYCLKNNISDFNQRMFNACLPKQCRREELVDNGNKLIEKISKNFEQHINTPLANSIDFETESKYCQQLGVNEQNAYLHIRGHHLFDLVSYIGDLLCRGTSVSFKNDILMKELPSNTYWQIGKVKEDISSIV